jgi:hypothetical protein
LIDLIEISGHSLLANTYVVIEAKKNLEIKFPQSLDYFNELLVRTQISSKVTPELKDTIAPNLVEKDRPVLSAAIQLDSDILVTGDNKHFGYLYGANIEGVTIHSPASLFSQLTGKSR